MAQLLRNYSVFSRDKQNKAENLFLLVNIVTFFCGRSLAGGRKSPLTASLTLAMKSLSLFFNNNWRNSDLTCLCKITHCPGLWLLFEKVNFLNGRSQIGSLTQSLVDLTGLPPVDSHLTCIVQTNSPCLSSHEDLCIFQFQQATIFTATLLFQPQLITTMYIQLHMIKHINRQFVVLHTCTHTFHTRHSEMHKKSLTTKDNTLLNLLW